MRWGDMKKRIDWRDNSGSIAPRVPKDAAMLRLPAVAPVGSKSTAGGIVSSCRPLLPRRRRTPRPSRSPESTDAVAAIDWVQ
ncbi:hypothetical protein CEXT_601451 [Caerostris extrusa]|uniref:Uncharacterized protein n=1 Tax=Caerostris extrusa TaxID=172846 RepID=A0AAV4QHP8_CAEEX|nr:hypothetical protein CEXT_601451 [Caerostris extrusa]